MSDIISTFAQKMLKNESAFSSFYSLLENHELDAPVKIENDIFWLLGKQNVLQIINTQNYPILSKKLYKAFTSSCYKWIGLVPNTPPKDISSNYAFAVDHLHRGVSMATYIILCIIKRFGYTNIDVEYLNHYPDQDYELFTDNQGVLFKKECIQDILESSKIVADYDYSKPISDEEKRYLDTKLKEISNAIKNDTSFIDLTLQQKDEEIECLKQGWEKIENDYKPRKTVEKVAVLKELLNLPNNLDKDSHHSFNILCKMITGAKENTLKRVISPGSLFKMSEARDKLLEKYPILRRKQQ